MFTPPPLALMPLIFRIGNCTILAIGELKIQLYRQYGVRVYGLFLLCIFRYHTNMYHTNHIILAKTSLIFRLSSQGCPSTFLDTNLKCFGYANPHPPLLGLLLSKIVWRRQYAHVTTCPHYFVYLYGDEEVRLGEQWLSYFCRTSYYIYLQSWLQNTIDCYTGCTGQWLHYSCKTRYYIEYICRTGCTILSIVVLISRAWCCVEKCMDLLL